MMCDVTSNLANFHVPISYKLYFAPTLHNIPAILFLHLTTGPKILFRLTSDVIFLHS